MNTEDQIKIMQAALDGKTVQTRQRGALKWACDVIPDSHEWNFEEWEYQIKTKPKVIWVNEYEDGSWAIYSTQHKAIGATGGLASKVAIKKCAVKYQEVIED